MSTTWGAPLTPEVLLQEFLQYVHEPSLKRYPTTGRLSARKAKILVLGLRAAPGWSWFALDVEPPLDRRVFTPEEAGAVAAGLQAVQPLNLSGYRIPEVRELQETDWLPVARLPAG